MKVASDGDRIIVRKLIKHINKEGLRVGDRLPSIRQLAAEWGVGTNAVRDGLLRAQTMGLVKIHPRSGAFVQSLDFSLLVDALADTLETALIQEDKSVFHLVEARRLIESETVAEAAVRRRPEDLLLLRQALEVMQTNVEDRTAFIEADEKFHLGIAKIAGNPVLVTMLRALLVLLRPYRMSLVPTPEDRQRTEHLHAEIYHSILNGDAERARTAMRQHITTHRQHLLDQVKTALGR